MYLTLMNLYQSILVQVIQSFACYYNAATESILVQITTGKQEMGKVFFYTITHTSLYEGLPNHLVIFYYSIISFGFRQHFSPLKKRTILGFNSCTSISEQLCKTLNIRMQKVMQVDIDMYYAGVQTWIQSVVPMSQVYSGRQTN